MNIELAVDGKSFLAELRSADGHCHNVKIPFTLAGVLLLRQILERQRMHPTATIGTPASPTQEMINAILKTQPKELTPVAWMEEIGDIEI